MKNEYFITDLIIKNVRNINNLDIQLNQDVRKHLILTGKNGAGKTSVLEAIDNVLNKLIGNEFATIESLKNNIRNYNQGIFNANNNIELYQKQIDIQTEQKNNLVENEQTKQQIAQIEASIKSYIS
ncbi:MAG: hypothetical protein RL154_232, partial [Pseudomonadota bacterium]